MRKIVMLIFLGFIAFTILVESGVFEALALFLLAGVVPGTNLTVPSGAMLLILLGIAWLVFVRFIVADIIHKLRHLRSDTQRKKRLPKRRFSQI